MSLPISTSVAIAGLKMTAAAATKTISISARAATEFAELFQDDANESSANVAAESIGVAAGHDPSSDLISGGNLISDLRSDESIPDSIRGAIRHLMNRLGLNTETPVRLSMGSGGRIQVDVSSADSHPADDASNGRLEDAVNENTPLRDAIGKLLGAEPGKTIVLPNDTYFPSGPT